MSNETLDILNHETWQKQLGLLATKFLSDSSSTFVMQNGQINNFCLSSNDHIIEENYRHYSWATDTNCFLKVEREAIFIHRWDKEVIEKVKTNNLNSEFYNHLYKYIGGFTQPKEKSVVPTIMDLFGKLRNASYQKNGLNALKSLLYLLAKSTESTSLESFGLENTIPSYLPESFEKIYDGFKKKIEIDGVLTTKLILRHASGRLFQEAHYQAHINNQLELFTTSFSSQIKYLKQQDKDLVGVHFTPAFITRSIVEEGLRKFDFNNRTVIKILDPACGSGEFLKEALRQIIERHPNYTGKIELHGWDKSQTAVTVANFSLKFEISQYNLRQIELQIIEQDSIICVWDKYDLIFMNPPFVSWEILDKDSQEKVQNALGDYSVNRPNLASPFFYKGIEALNDNGVIGCILPSSIFNADSYEKLREYSNQQLNINLIGKLGNLNLFYNAVVDAGLYIGAKTRTPDPTTIIWADNSLNSTTNALRNLRKFQNNPYITIDEESYSIYKSEVINEIEEFPKCISYQSVILEQKLKEYIISGYMVYLKDIFDVRQGARTGANNAFIIDVAFYNTLEKEEKTYFRPAITNRSINNGITKTTDYIWFPYGNKKIKSDDELIKVAPMFYNLKLRSISSKLKSRTEVLQHKYPWWELTRERVWQNIGAKIVSTEFGKSGSFAYEKSGEYVVERGYAWIFNDSIINNFDDNLNHAYLALFSSSFINQLLALYSKQIAGGQYYLARKFVNNIPIPDLNSVSMKGYTDELIKFGKEISNGKLDSIQENLDLLVKSIYIK